MNLYMLNVYINYSYLNFGGSVELLSRLDLITLIFDSSLGLGICKHVFLSSICPRMVNSDPISPMRKIAIFETDSIDYSLKSV